MNKLQDGRTVTDIELAETPTADMGQPEANEIVMKDFERVLDIFHAAVIPDNLFWISILLIVMEIMLLCICFFYTRPEDEVTDLASIFLVCVYASVAAVTESFGDIQAIFIGFKGAMLLNKENKEKGGSFNGRRMILGSMQILKSVLLLAIMALIVPLQGSPVDIILNSTAFLAIMQLDSQILRFLGYTYVYDVEAVAYEKIAMKDWMPRQKKILCIMIVTTFSVMNTVAQYSFRVV